MRHISPAILCAASFCLALAFGLLGGQWWRGRQDVARHAVTQPEDIARRWDPLRKQASMSRIDACVRELGPAARRRLGHRFALLAHAGASALQEAAASFISSWAEQQPEEFCLFANARTRLRADREGGREFESEEFTEWDLAWPKAFLRLMRQRPERLRELLRDTPPRLLEVARHLAQEPACGQELAGSPGGRAVLADLGIAAPDQPRSSADSSPKPASRPSLEQRQAAVARAQTKNQPAAEAAAVRGAARGSCCS